MNTIEEYIQYKKLEYKSTGNNQFVLRICPECSDQKGHFYINQESGLYNCKKCNSSGNYNQFRQLYGDNAIDINGVDLSVLPVQSASIVKKYTILNNYTAIEQHERLKINSQLIEYLNNRGIPQEVIDHFKIGTDGENITIPLFENEELVNIMYRRNPSKDISEDIPKYWLEKGCKSVLFNSEIFNKDEGKAIIITEGVFDAMVLWNNGIKHVISITLGASSFPDNWVDYFSKYKTIYLCFDNETSKIGYEGAKKVAEKLGKNKCRFISLPIPEGQTKTDITDFFIRDKQPAQAFIELVRSAKYLLNGEASDIVHISELMKIVENRILHGDDLGIATGFENLDKAMGGLRKGRLVILSGKPNSGKSALSLNIVRNLSLSDVPSFVFSLEMPPIDVARRLLLMENSITNTEIDQIKTPEDKNMIKCISIMKLFDDRPIYLYRQSGQVAFKKFQDSARYAVLELGCRLVVVDHLHFFAHSVMNKTSETANIVREMKLLAIELNVCILCLAHIKRTQNKEAMLTDLKDSSSLEGDADQVLFLYRKSESSDIEEKKKTELKIAKNRDGKAGDKIPMNFDLDHLLFTELNAIEIQKQEMQQEKSNSNLPW